MGNEKVIEVRNVTKTFRNGFTALTGVTFDIRKGEIIGYLGPNGAGKTTTIKILTNLIRPSSGHALVSGIDITKSPKEALRHIGALIEVPGVYGYLTPREVLRYFGRIHGMKRRKIEERTNQVLKKVSLDQWRDRRISCFSTGMQRRFAIAKGMLHEPEILILDEPVLGLDPQGIMDIRNMIRELSKEGMTILLSSHLLPEVSETCEKVILIDKGRILKIDKVSDIAVDCRSSIFETELLGTPSPRVLKDIVGMDLVRRISLTGNTLKIDCSGGYERGNELLVKLVEYGLEMRSFTPLKKDMEDYYMETLRREEEMI